MDAKELKKKTVSGVFWRFGERITAQLITLVVSIVLARILLPEEYGVVALLTIFITLANTLVASGLGASLVQDKRADRNDFSTMFYASLGLAVVLYAILFFCAPLVADLYGSDTLIPLLRVMGIKIPIAAISSIQQAYVSKKMIYKKFFFATLVGTVISGVVGIAMALVGFGAWAIVVQYLTNSAIDMIVLGLTIDWRPKLYFSYQRFRKLFSYGWKIMATNFIGAFFDQLKSLVIGVKYKADDLAYYSKGDQFPAVIKDNVNQTVETVFFSTLSELQDDKKRLKNAASKMMRVSSFVILPFLLGLAGVAYSFVEIVLTDKWLDVVPFMQIFCIQYCYSVIGTINIQTIKSLGRSDIMLKLEFVKKPLFLVFIAIGLNFGPIGVAMANMLYGIIATIINIAPNSKLVGYDIKDQLFDFLPAFFAASLMGVVVHLVGMAGMNLYLKFLLQITVGIVVYSVLSAIFMRETFHEAVKMMKKIVRREKSVQG